MFTEKEQKIRKKWLFWVIKIPVFIMIPGIFLLIIASIYSLLVPNFYFNQIGFHSLNKVVSVFLSIGILYLVYYCAYKTPGVACLLLLLALLSIVLLGYAFTTTYLITKHINQSSLDNKGLDLFISNILSVILSSFYYLRVCYLSFKMLKINKNMAEKKLLSSEQYLNASAILSSATSIQQLNENYKNLFNEEEPVKFRLFIWEIYESKKEILELEA